MSGKTTRVRSDRDRHVIVWLLADELSAILAAAKARGMTVNEWIRWSIATTLPAQGEKSEG